MKLEEPALSGGQSYVEINDIQVPVFSTAYEQLNYTRSWFAEIDEKRAALEAFIKLFPDEKKYCGIAALDLAYLKLGKDYRFSYEQSAISAINQYLVIIEEYAEYADILAKAYWYIGWIYADLLHETDKGVEYFNRVVQSYPDEFVSLLPPAPWVFLTYPNPPGSHGLAKPNRNSWAALALVEIIRYSDPEDAWRGFTQLWRKYRRNAAAGFGLRLILKRRIRVEEVVALAHEYMETSFSNIHLLGDIRKELIAIAESELEGNQ